MTVGATTVIGRFVEDLRLADIPISARAIVTDAITDCIGVALAGASEADIDILRKLVACPDGEGRIIGSSARSSLPDAAYVNGASAHILEYDDLSHPAYSHVSSHLVPVILGLAQVNDVNGATALSAYIAGLEVEQRLGQMLNTAHYEKGWHSTGTLGSIGSAVTAAVMLQLSASETSNAIGIAASSASGLRVNIGSRSKPLHAGGAARAGILAGLLAARGWNAAGEVIDGQLGFVDVFRGAPIADGDVWSDLGSSWATLGQFAMALKPYPSCGATHAAVEAALLLADLVRDRWIEQVIVGVTPLANNILRFKIPQDQYEARFSLPYLIAIALVDRKVTLDSFKDSKLADSRILSLASRVLVTAEDPRVRDCTEFAASVQVKCASSEVLDQVVLMPKGRPDRWLPTAEIYRKFLECASPALGEDGASSLFQDFQHIEQATSVKSISSRLWANVPGDETY